MNTNTDEINELMPLITQPAATTRRSFIKRTAAAALATTFAFDAFAEISICGRQDCSLSHYHIFLTKHDHPNRTSRAYKRPGTLDQNLSAMIDDLGVKPGDHTFAVAAGFSWKKEPKGTFAPGIDKDVKYTCHATFEYLALLVSDRRKMNPDDAVTLQNAAIIPSDFVDAGWKKVSVEKELVDIHSEALKDSICVPSFPKSESANREIAPVTLKFDLHGIGDADYGTLSGSLLWTYRCQAVSNAVLSFDLGVKGSLKLAHKVVKYDESGVAYFKKNPTTQEDVIQTDIIEIEHMKTYNFDYISVVLQLPQNQPTPNPVPEAVPTAPTGLS